MKREFSKRKIKSSTLYKSVIFGLLGLYAVFYGLSFFNSNTEHNTSTKLYKEQSLNNYSFYLVDKKYNPDTKTLVAKIFFRKEKENDQYIPITKDYFSVKAESKADATSKIKTNLMMPTKDYLVIVMENVEANADEVRMALNMKTDIISQDKDNKGTNLTMYFDLPNKIYDKNLKVKTESEYVVDANKEEVVFIERDIKSKEKKQQKLEKEIKIANEQIDIIQSEKKKMTSDEKVKAEYTINDFKAKIDESNKKLESTRKSIENLKDLKQRTENGAGDNQF